jgi:hypothetical protein
MVMANVGKIPGDDRLPDAIAGTMATEFASVFRWQAEPFNEIVVGFRDPVTAATLRSRLAGAPAQLAKVAGSAEHLVPVGPSSDPLTDDHAPVEWLTDRMIVDFIAEGGELAERPLPTQP